MLRFLARLNGEYPILLAPVTTRPAYTRSETQLPDGLLGLGGFMRMA
jgi:hypothetical protein